MPLHRTTTYNPRRITRSQSLGAVTRKASKAGAKLKRTASLAARREVKNVALSLKETKLFKADWQSAGYSVSQVSGKACAARGFVTTSAADPAGGPTLDYGATVITDLHMARPFHNDNADDNLAQMALEGRRCIPTRAHNDLLVERSPFGVDTVAKANSSAAVYCRLITVTPKGPAGTTMTTDPGVDLFITAWGEETGIDKTGTLEMGSGDLAQAVVNPNKYKVLRDETKILHQPVTHANQLVAGGSVEDQTKTLSGQPSIVRWRIKHQIADKPGGQLLYNNPNTAVSPQAGHRREYTFLHFWQPGQINPTQFAQLPGSLIIRCRPYSAFKDG